VLPLGILTVQGTVNKPLSVTGELTGNGVINGPVSLTGNGFIPLATLLPTSTLHTGALTLGASRQFQTGIGTGYAPGEAFVTGGVELDGDGAAGAALNLSGAS